MWVIYFLPFYVGWISVYLGLLFSWWLLNMTSRRSSYMDFVNSQVLWRYRRRNSTWSQCSFTDCPHEYPARQCRLLSGSTFGRFEVFLWQRRHWRLWQNFTSILRMVIHNMFWKVTSKSSFLWFPPFERLCSYFPDSSRLLSFGPFLACFRVLDRGSWRLRSPTVGRWRPLRRTPWGLQM